jgi:hypothetical protein
VDLKYNVRCVVFRNKRGRYTDQRPVCPTCGDPANYDSLYRPDGLKHGMIVGITHQDAKEWREGGAYGSRQAAGS